MRDLQGRRGSLDVRSPRSLRQVPADLDYVVWTKFSLFNVFVQFVRLLENNGFDTDLRDFR